MAGATLEAMSRGRWAAVASTLAIAAVAVVTAGCGGGGALALDPVAAAATKTEQAGAAHVRFTVAFSGARTHGKTVRISGAGAVDGTSSKLTLRMGSLFRRLGLPAGAASSLTPTQLRHAKLTEITLEQNGDYVVYVGSSLLSTQLPGGQHWVEVDLSKLGKAAGVDLGSLLSGSQFQPGDVLSMLEAEGAKVRSLGPATVRGAATTHYRVQLDVAKALQAKGLNNPLLAAAAANMPKIPLDVWIGKDGLLHRVRAAFAQTEKGAPAHATLTMDVFDYGAHVTIGAPPSGDVFDATQLVQSFGSLSH
jgi:hypothetical protein